MLKLKIWTPVLIACVAGFATAGATTGLITQVGTVGLNGKMTTARISTLPMCPTAKSNFSRPATKFYERFLGRTPMSKVAAR